MNRALKQESSASKLCSLEVFGVNGSKTISGNQSILFTKIVTSDKSTQWVLLHQN